MREAGVDISRFTSDDIRDFKAADFDIVISCCGCGAKLDPDDLKAWKAQFKFMDWALDDPPAIDPGDLSEYRRVRDEVKVKCEELLARIKDPELWEELDAGADARGAAATTPFSPTGVSTTPLKTGDRPVLSNNRGRPRTATALLKYT